MTTTTITVESADNGAGFRLSSVNFCLSEKPAKIIASPRREYCRSHIYPCGSIVNLYYIILFVTYFNAQEFFMLIYLNPPTPESIGGCPQIPSLL